jgi:hypothetical protein
MTRWCPALKGSILNKAWGVVMVECYRIGAVLGAILVVGTNLYLTRNSNKVELQERIEKLYSPLYEYYLENMRYGSEEPYNNFLKKIYIKTASMHLIY